MTSKTRAISPPFIIQDFIPRSHIEPGPLLANRTAASSYGKLTANLSPRPVALTFAEISNLFGGIIDGSILLFSCFALKLDEYENHRLLR